MQSLTKSKPLLERAGEQMAERGQLGDPIALAHGTQRLFEFAVEVDLVVHPLKFGAQYAGTGAPDPFDRPLEAQQAQRQDHQVDHLRKLGGDPLGSRPPAVFECGVGEQEPKDGASQAEDDRHWTECPAQAQAQQKGPAGGDQTHQDLLGHEAAHVGLALDEEELGLQVSTAQASRGEEHSQRADQVPQKRAEQRIQGLPADDRDRRAAGAAASLRYSNVDVVLPQALGERCPADRHRGCDQKQAEAHHEGGHQQWALRTSTRSSPGRRPR